MFINIIKIIVQLLLS